MTRDEATIDGIQVTTEATHAHGRPWPISRLYFFKDGEGNFAVLRAKNGRQYKSRPHEARWKVAGRTWKSLHRAGTTIHNEGHTELSDFLLRLADYFLDDQAQPIGRK